MLPPAGVGRRWARLVSNQGPLACEARPPAVSNIALSRGSASSPSACRGRGCAWICADVRGYGHRIRFQCPNPDVDQSALAGGYWAGDVAGERGALRGADAWSRGDREAYLQTISPGWEFNASGVFPGLQPEYRGPEGARELWDATRGPWDEFR